MRKFGDLCESAKCGKLCVDDLCHGGNETLCGFDPDLYAEILGEEDYVGQDVDFEAEEEDGN